MNKQVEAIAQRRLTYSPDGVVRRIAEKDQKVKAPEDTIRGLELSGFVKRVASATAKSRAKKTKRASK